MTYPDAVEYLLSLIGPLRSSNFGLERMQRLAAALGNPEKSFRVVHIAGTNGKGSTAAMIEAGLRAAGHTTGLFTSPHLVRFNERIRLNGEEIGDSDFAATVDEVRAANDRLADELGPHSHPTLFESMTAAAFCAFRAAGIEWGVVEVGLGGRLDATNIVQSELAVITPIHFDHEAYLGNGAAAIAAEKAGIVKAGIVRPGLVESKTRVVTAPQMPEALAVIEKRCAEVGASLVRVGSDWKAENLSHTDGRYHFEAVCNRGTCNTATGDRLPVELALAGEHQVENALTAIAALDCLRVEAGGAASGGIWEQSIRAGLADVRWPGRIERLGAHPEILVDAAHNPSGARALAKFLREHRAGRRMHLVYGAVRDKAIEEATGLLFPCVDRVILTRSRISRSVSPEGLLAMVDHHHENISVAPNLREALERAKAGATPDDVIVIAGSIFLVGEAKEVLESVDTLVREPR